MTGRALLGWVTASFLLNALIPDATWATPMVAITQPQNGATVTAQVWVDAVYQSSSQEPVVRLELLVDGAVVRTYALPTPRLQGETSFSYTFQTQNAEVHRLSVRAVDKAGGVGEASISVTVKGVTLQPTQDRTPPIVNIYYPHDGQRVSGTVEIKVDAQDNTGVEWVFFYLDGQIKAMIKGNPPYVDQWDTTRCADGEHELQAKALDAAENAGLSAPVRVVVANRARTTLQSAGREGSGVVAAPATALPPQTAAPAAPQLGAPGSPPPPTPLQSGAQAGPPPPAPPQPAMQVGAGASSPEAIRPAEPRPAPVLKAPGSAAGGSAARPPGTTRPGVSAPGAVRPSAPSAAAAQAHRAPAPPPGRAAAAAAAPCQPAPAPGERLARASLPASLPPRPAGLVGPVTQRCSTWPALAAAASSAVGGGLSAFGAAKLGRPAPAAVAAVAGGQPTAERAPAYPASPSTAAAVKPPYGPEQLALRLASPATGVGKTFVAPLLQRAVPPAQASGSAAAVSGRPAEGRRDRSSLPSQPARVGSAPPQVEGRLAGSWCALGTSGREVTGAKLTAPAQQPGLRAPAPAAGRAAIRESAAEAGLAPRASEVYLLAMVPATRPAQAAGPKSSPPARGRVSLQPQAMARFGEVQVLLDGKLVPLRACPEVRGGIPVGPLREIFEHCDGVLYWFPVEKRVRAVSPTTSLELRIGVPTARVNERTEQLELAPYIKHGRTMVPLGFLAQTLNLTISFDTARQQLIISRNDM
jgi:hypothetical protein